MAHIDLRDIVTDADREAVFELRPDPATKSGARMDREYSVVVRITPTRWRVG